MSNLLKKIGNFEKHHRILFYTSVMFATIVFIRMGVQVYNPNPILFHLELHHFDYGVILLLVTAILLLFGSHRFKDIYLVLAAFSSALIIDGYLALRLAVVEAHENPLSTYNETIGSVAVLAVVVTLVALFIHSLGRKRDTMPQHKR